MGPHWSYSGFIDFRVRLAAEIGITLKNMPGFESLARKETNTNVAQVRDALLRLLLGPDMMEVIQNVPPPKSMLKWPSPEREPLVLLLNHSDCDGKLSAKECGAIFPRLLEIAKTWSAKEDLEHMAESYDRHQALMLADMMERAAKENLTLVFC
jgi:hypothetical protein